jgi:co-chaperonin GroES (HSP10)
MITPLKNNVIARKLAPMEQEINGIIVRTQPHRDDRYLVLYVGPDVIDVSVGDIVYIKPNVDSQYLTHEGDTLRHVAEENIYAIAIEQ